MQRNEIPIDEDPNSMESIVKNSLLSKNTLAIILKGDDGVLQYCCVQCPVRYTCKEKLQMHLYTHNNEYRYLCGICGTGLKRKEHLDRHILGHNEIRPHVCETCGKAFKRKEHMNIHRAIHGGEKNLNCSVCQKSFYRKDHLQKHMQTHCDSSQECFDAVSMLGSAVEVTPVFNDSQLTRACEIKMEPEDDVESSPSLNRSMSAHNARSGRSQEVRPARPHACPTCGKCFKRKDHLNVHKLTHTKKSFACSECGSSFHKQEQLFNHMSVHLGSVPMSEEEAGADVKEEPIDHDAYDDNSLLVPMSSQSYYESRPHQCPVCHRRFKRKQHLKVHSNVHFKRGPAAWCMTCNAGFDTDVALSRHRCARAAPPAGPDSPHSASSAHDTENYCPLEFVQAEHGTGAGAGVDAGGGGGGGECAPIAIVDETRAAIPRPQRVFVCKYCGKAFKRKDHFRIHQHIHTGVKNFHCPDCGKGFYRKDHLQKHVQVHRRQPEGGAAPRPAAPPTRRPPALLPIGALKRAGAAPAVRPEITIHAPSSAKLRVPLQIKVPYQMVVQMEDGERRAVTVDPHDTHDAYNAHDTYDAHDTYYTHDDTHDAYDAHDERDPLDTRDMS